MSMSSSDALNIWDSDISLQFVCKHNFKKELIMEKQIWRKFAKMSSYLQVNVNFELDLRINSWKSSRTNNILITDKKGI